MITQPKPPFSFQEYQHRDNRSKEKLEFYAGLMLAQAGASARQQLIVANIMGHLQSIADHQAAHIYASDLRVQAVDQWIYTYPDVTIVNGEPVFAAANNQNVVNPSVIIEVMSPATEARDRKEKLEYYRQIASLQEYLLVAQHAPYVQRFVRQSTHLWHVQMIDDLTNTVRIEALAYDLPMATLYASVDFEAKL